MAADDEAADAAEDAAACAFASAAAAAAIGETMLLVDDTEQLEDMEDRDEPAVSELLPVLISSCIVDLINFRLLELDSRG